MGEWLHEGRDEWVKNGTDLESNSQICAAVHFAHQRLVIHRDLKPGNILVTAEGEPKLMDFGVAKLLAPAQEDGSATLTAAGNRPTTPAYASPEQVRGDAITTASDVYSLGALLHELLADQPAHAVAGLPVHEAARIVCEQEPPRPSVASGRRELRGDLDNILLRAMNKEPARRYLSAATWTACRSSRARIHFCTVRTNSSSATKPPRPRWPPSRWRSSAAASPPRGRRSAPSGSARGRSGDLAGAESHYVRAGEVLDGLRADDPDPVHEQLRLSQCRGYLSSLRGHARDALDPYRRNLAIGQPRSDASPGEVTRKRFLMNAQKWVAITLREDGQPEQALAMHRRALQLCGEILAIDPTNIQTNNDLADVSHEIGNTLLCQNDADAALEQCKQARRYYLQEMTLEEKLLQMNLRPPPDKLAAGRGSYSQVGIARLGLAPIQGSGGPRGPRANGTLPVSRPAGGNKGPPHRPRSAWRPHGTRRCKRRPAASGAWLARSAAIVRGLQ